MQTTNFEDVLAFLKHFGIPCARKPALLVPGTELYKFRLEFLQEEYREFIKACQESNLPDQFDALLDFAYVAYGTLGMMGFTSLPVTLPTWYATLGKPKQACSGPEHKVVQNIWSGLQDFQKVAIKGNLAGQVDILIFLIGQAMQLAQESNFPWQQGWDIVHAANMKKQKITKAEQSKRATLLDVVKPEGWVAPDHSYLWTEK